MIVGAMTIKFYVPWVHSLKEKRMVVKSICGKAGNKFNISIAEVDAQDVHQTILRHFFRWHAAENGLGYGRWLYLPERTGILLSWFFYHLVGSSYPPCKKLCNSLAAIRF